MSCGNSTLPETIKMFDYLVFEFPFWGITEGDVRISNLVFRTGFFQGFEFRYSNLIFGELFVACPNFEFCSSDNSRFPILRVLPCGWRRSWTITISNFVGCCPAGGVEFEKSRFSIFSMLPCGRRRFWKITFFVFVVCPPNGKTHVFGWIWASGVC